MGVSFRSHERPTHGEHRRAGMVVGAYEKPARLKVFKNRDFCGPWIANEILLVSSHGRVQNTVVVLQPMERQASAPASIVLDNRNCALLLMFKWRRWEASRTSRIAIRFFTLSTPVGQGDVIQRRASQVEASHEVSYTERHYQN